MRLEGSLLRGQGHPQLQPRTLSGGEKKKKQGRPREGAEEKAGLLQTATKRGYAPKSVPAHALGCPPPARPPVLPAPGASGRARFKER